MRISVLFTAALVTLNTSSDASAEMNSAKRNQASGLAQIMAFSKACDYQLNQEALEAHFAEAGLSDAETLAYIHNRVVIISEPAPGECAITKATAKPLGLIQ
ncbi:hypothetical protein AMC78_CH03184 [Rhizobium phaseoli]|uniref:hypothetical protein n=1 Tax=Rhizobium phaseoli TaxID=396 RepID=UPI0007EBF2AC|nr:hypothetical protein [Rhizobium phaseoli]ANM05253.1 hypothetical protein AMC78_CH03184 [Rhizobium phaseoli]